MLSVYLLLLVARWIMDLVFAFSRSFRPSGPATLGFEVVYTATDPPLKLLRRLIPPLRLGSVALDLAFLVLFVVVVVLRQQAHGL